MTRPPGARRDSPSARTKICQSARDRPRDLPGHGEIHRPQTIKPPRLPAHHVEARTRKRPLRFAGTTLAPKLLGRFEKVAPLPDEERNAVLLDSVIAKHTLRKLMGP